MPPPRQSPAMKSRRRMEIVTAERIAALHAIEKTIRGKSAGTIQ